MKTIQLTLILLCTSLASFAQVGIGNTDPKATLDITASNTATPSSTDGILIPKIDNFPATNPGTDQNGMLVFVTGNGTPTKGFYYWDNALTSWVSVVGTKNTLEQAYNEGGAGAGKNINASDGAIRINGTDGLLITGTLNSGNTIDTEITGAGTRMFFNPRTGSFRAGEVNGTQWSDANLGDRSVAFGNNNTASGNSSTALGANNVSSGNRSLTVGDTGVASGQNSVAMGDESDATGNNSFSQGFRSTASGTTAVAMGLQNNAPSWGEITVGTFATTYTQNSATSWNTSDRVFTVGNGAGTSARSNALTIYKNGLININDSYNLPLTDGTANQVMTTDGAGNLSFQNVAASADTDDQAIDTFNFNTATNVLTLELEDDGQAAQTVNLSSLQDGNTQNNLDQAYDEGGAGVGKNINATDGAVRINGTDGFLVTGILNSGNTIDTEITGAGTRMFFNPRTGSFRAGQVDGTQWSNANLGSRSVAFGNNNIASGNASTAFGANNISSGNRSLTVGDTGIASGQNSVSMGDESDAIGNNAFAQGYRSTASAQNAVAMGLQNNAPSWGEMTVGTFATTYTQNSTASWNTSDRVFTVGNGTGTSARSNALTIYKNGLININDSYNMPLTDGAANQVLTTDGAGNVSFQNVAASTDTDDQTIDNLTLNGTILELSLEDDGQPIQTLNLASIATKHDWYEENTTTEPNAITDDIYTQGNVAIGKNNTIYKLDIETTSGARAINTRIGGTASGDIIGHYITNNNTGVGSHYGQKIDLTGIGNGWQRGVEVIIDNTGNSSKVGYNVEISGIGVGNKTGYRSIINNANSGNNYGLYNEMTGSNDAEIWGVNNQLLGNTSGNIYGTYNNLNALGTGTKYGTHTTILSALGGTHYGLYMDVQNTSGYAAYLIGRTSLGNGTANRYLMPAADGTANQVLTTDGAGNTSWQNANSGAERINDLIDGKSDNDGSNNGSSIFIGLQAGLTDDESNNQNVGIGYYSLNNNSNGDYNTAIGYLSLRNNISGQYNTAIGYSSLASNTASLNTANGAFCLMGNTSGNSNTAMGTESMRANNTGSRNAAFGQQSLSSNTDGSNNTAIGAQSLYNNSTGVSNTAIGSSSLFNNISGFSNIAIGSTSQYERTSGASNIAIGFGSLRNNLSGGTNIAIGTSSLLNNILGSNNVAIGPSSGANETGSNKLYIENSNSSTPLIYGTFDTDEVGINWNSAVALPNTLSVNGNASKTTAGAWLANSDARLKKDIKTMNSQDMLNKILAMRGVTYTWNDDKTGLDRPDTIQYGFIAQDLQKIWPTKVSEDGLGYLQTAYGDYDAMFVEAFKAQQAQIEALKKENKTLIEKLNKLEQLEARLSALEQNNSVPN